MTELEKAALMALEFCEFCWRDVAMNDYALEKLEQTTAALTQALATTEPIPMVLHCPKCGMQHIDEAEDERTEQICHGPEVVDEVIVGWDNPPHRSHLCHGCGTIWRPADVPTTGVAAITTKGKADTWEPGKITTTEPKLHSPEWFVEKRRAAVDRIASMPEAMQQNMHYASATLPATTERKLVATPDHNGALVPASPADMQVYDKIAAGYWTEHKGEPFGQVTVKHPVGPFHAPLYTFYPWPQPPYLDNVQECHTVYTSPQVPEDAALLDYLDTLASRPAGSDLHCFGGRVVLYIRTGVGSQIQASGSGTARDAIRSAMLDAARKGE